MPVALVPRRTPESLLPGLRLRAWLSISCVHTECPLGGCDVQHLIQLLLPDLPRLNLHRQLPTPSAPLCLMLVLRLYQLSPVSAHPTHQTNKRTFLISPTTLSLLATLLITHLNAVGQSVIFDASCVGAAAAGGGGCTRACEGTSKCGRG